MLKVHILLGLAIVLISILLLLWNLLRVGLKLKGPSLRPVLMGLIDLQLVLGVITFIMYPHGGAFLLHPLTMIIAAVIAHTAIKDSRPARTQLFGYIAIVILLLLGVLIFGKLA